MSMNSLKDIERQRAQYAYNCAVKGSQIKNRGEYKSYVKKIPMLIKTNGLAPTFAFIYSKRSDDSSKSGYAYKMIYDQVKEWLIDEDLGLIDISNSSDLQSDNELVKKIIELDSSTYRAITEEILSFFNWLRRFAEGLIKE
ncbi:type III-B CRISPR module-associated protein Cmr5 [Thermoanaerobacterium thermosaccharolyticum]|uniref:type III-B CRISPR module-associated protein Cmr5 n=1 Tax=Thermoanaerobacterium thermosaccharolyticum TaxID=1517 RepID=UPI003DA7D1B5